MSAVSLKFAVVSPRFNGLIRWWNICVLITGIILVLIPQSNAANAYSSLRWRWSNPAPFGSDIYDMTYGLGLTVAVTELGGIYTSEDLLLWEPRESHLTNALRAVTFFGHRIVIVGERGAALSADSLYDFRNASIATEDWLEGLAASSNLLVAVGDNGAIYTSTSGASWARQTTTITAWLSGVAYGQGNFVTVGENGLIATSPNGTNWTKRNSNTTRYLYRVGWAANQFLAVGEGGIMLSSVNGGLNWTVPSNVGATGALYSATATSDSHIAAGDHELRLRRPGASWSNELDPTKVFPAPSWTYFNALWEDSLYLVSGRSGMIVEGFQTNQTSPFVWVDRSQPLRNWLWELKRLPDFYITVGYRGTVMTSVNGLEWSLELVPDSATNSTLLGVGGTTNMLLAVGSRGTILVSPKHSTDVIVTNLDGISITNSVGSLGIFWHAVPPPTTNDLQGVAVFNNQFVVTGDQGCVLTSADGTNWVRRQTPTGNFLTGVAAFPSGLVAVGRSGTLLTSPDGVYWTAQTTGTTNWLYRARCLDGQGVIVGQNGTLLTSPDGLSWTRHPGISTRWLNDMTRLGNTYYAVGTQGAVLTTTNWTNWTSIGTITEKSLYGVASHEGQLVVAGVEGSIVRSQVIPDLSPVRILNFSRRDQQNLYLFSGKPDQRFTLDWSATLTNWNLGPTLEFLDGTGTLLLLENHVTNAPSTEFYRATATP